MKSGQLCYLDFGMVSYGEGCSGWDGKIFHFAHQKFIHIVEASQRYSIIEAIVHMVNRDFVSLAELYRRFAAHNPHLRWTQILFPCSFRMGFIPKEVDISPIVVALEVWDVNSFLKILIKESCS